jgi:WD40 repeat protein
MFGVKEGIARANVYYPGPDNTVRFWNLRSGQQTGIIPTGLGPQVTWAVTGLAVSSDRSRLAVTTGRFSDSAASVWEIATKRRLNYLPMKVGYGAFAPSFSSDDRELLVFQGDTTMRTYNLAHLTEIRSQKWDVSASNPDMRVLCMTPDHKFLFGARANFTISLWSTADGRLVREFKGHTDIIRGLALSQDNRLLASCSNDGTVRVWVMDSGVQKTILHPGGDVRAVSFVGLNDRMVVSAGDDRIATLWNLDNALPLQRFIGHTDTIGCLCVSQDGSLLITGSEDKTARSWNILSQNPNANQALATRNHQVSKLLTNVTK